MYKGININNYKPLGKMKTLLTEDLPDYDDDAFQDTRAQTKFTATGHYLIPPKNLANNSASNSTSNSLSSFGTNSANNYGGNFSNNTASKQPRNLGGNLAGNLLGSQASNSKNAIESTLLTGVLEEVLTGDKTRQTIADNKIAKENQLAQENEAARQRAQAQAQAQAQAGAQATPKRVMSKEEEWYPVTYAQKQKEKEEAEWVANNPNATSAELFYPSMRKKPAVTQAEAQPESQVNLSESFRAENKETFNARAQQEAIAKKEPTAQNANAASRFPYNELSEEQQEELFSINSPAKSHRRDSFPFNNLTEEQQDAWIASEEERNKVSKKIREEKFQALREANKGKNLNKASSRFPYNELTPEQQEKLHGINPLYNTHRRDSFPLNELNPEQQDLWLYPEEKRKGIDQVISINPIVQEKYASLESSARRAEKFEADFPLLFEHVNNKEIQTILSSVQNEHEIHAQNSIRSGVKAYFASFSTQMDCEGKGSGWGKWRESYLSS